MDIENVEIEKDLTVTAKDEEKSKAVDYSSLTRQCKKEYDVAYKFMQPKIAEWLMRLKLYNNQKRDKDAVGDTTMFTTFQTVLASLYSDKLNVSFGGREEGDDETAQNLELMANSDYDDMEKEQIDFNWDWDTCFCGRGLVLLEEFERDRKNNIFLPLPENIDFLTWLRDPRATSVNGSRKGKGAMRFGGSEIKISKTEMEENANFFDDIKFKELQYGESTQ